MRVARLFLRMDDKKEHTEVHFFGILDLFSQIGGLISFLVKLGMVLTTYLAYDFLIANFIRDLFMIRNNEDRAETEAQAESREDTKRRLFKLKQNSSALRTKDIRVSLDATDIANVVHEASQVNEFRFNLTGYICFLLKLVARLFRCKHRKANNGLRKKSYDEVFKAGRDELEHYLDVEPLIRQTRDLRLLMKALLTDRQRLLFEF